MTRRRAPFRNACRYAGIQCLQIGLHRAGFEGDRKCAPVQPVLVKVHHHQSAREDTVHKPPPTQLGRKIPLLVEQHKLVGGRT